MGRTLADSTARSSEVHVFEGGNAWSFSGYAFLNCKSGQHRKYERDA